MEMNDLKVRRIYMAYVSSKVRASRTECPPVRELREAFEAKTRRRAKNRVVDHISKCAHCAEEFQFIHGMRTRERELAEEIRGIARNGRSFEIAHPLPIWSYTAVLGVIAILIAGVFTLKRPHLNDAGRNKPVLIPEVLAPSGHIEIDPQLLFKWRPVKGAASYVIEIYDASLRFIWESPPIATTAAILPAQLWELLAAETDYFWSISAYDSEGKIGESRFEVFSFDR
jgi:hypothetical protein